MGNRRSSQGPLSIAPETRDIDESWEELENAMEGVEPLSSRATPHVFDRTTAVPPIPVEQLAAELMTTGESEPDSRVRNAAPPGRGMPDGRATAPELEVTTEPLDAALALELEGDLEGEEERMALLPGEAGGTAAPSTPGVPGPAGGAAEDSSRAAAATERPRGPAGGPEPQASSDNLELQIESSLEPGSVLELVDRQIGAPRSRPPSDAIDLEGPHAVASDSGGSTIKGMKDRYAVGDYTGALVVAESILESNPQDVEARRYAQSCREVLTQMYSTRLGPLDQIVSVVVPPEQITWLSLDHRAGFLLSLVDGVSSVEEILDISGMSRLDALRILYTLAQQNVIALQS